MRQRDEKYKRYKKTSTEVKKEKDTVTYQLTEDARNKIGKERVEKQLL